jgi:deoxyribonuclease V
MDDFNQLHSWSLSPKEAVRLQEALRNRVVTRGAAKTIRWIVGVDVAYSRKKSTAKAAAVVCRLPNLDVVEERVALGKIEFPYIPGLLSFREAPIALEALSGLSHPIDCLLVDGHGLSHPRRFGLGCHLGLWVNRPTIGCAKSKLFGNVASPPGEQKGCSEPVKDELGHVIGAAVTTRDGCAPLYVSVGHKVSLERAVEIVLACCLATKHPEPLRIADRLSKF